MVVNKYTGQMSRRDYYSSGRFNRKTAIEQG